MNSTATSNLDFSSGSGDHRRWEQDVQAELQDVKEQLKHEQDRLGQVGDVQSCATCFYFSLESVNLFLESVNIFITVTIVVVIVVILINSNSRPTIL